MLALAIFAIGLVNCTVTETGERSQSSSVTAPPTSTSLIHSDESLAEAMLQAYPNIDSVDYLIVDDEFFPEGSEIRFDFADIRPEDIAGLTTIGDEITSPHRSFRAFVACEVEHCQPRLFVESLTDTQLVEITFSQRMPGRPLAGLSWLDDRTLAFSQWSNPHYGFRHAVDLNREKHLLTLWLAGEGNTPGD
jgi:hypothetical protein